MRTCKARGGTAQRSCAIGTVGTLQVRVDSATRRRCNRLKPGYRQCIYGRTVAATSGGRVHAYRDDKRDADRDRVHGVPDCWPIGIFARPPISYRGALDLQRPAVA